MAEAQTRQAMVSRPIVVHIPAEVTFDLAKFGRVIADLGERLGCKPCISGADCNFRIIKEFIVDPATLKVGVHPMPRIGMDETGSLQHE